MSNEIHPSLQRIYEVSNIKKPSELAMALNVGASTVTNWGKRGVSKEGALAVSEKYGVSANYILNGEQLVNSESPVADVPQFIHGANLDHIVIGQHTDYPLVEIEYLNVVACCGPGYANENYPEAFTQSFTVEFLRANGLPIDGKGLVLMHACGDSMGNTIPAGTVILVNKKEADFSVFINNKIYVFNVNGEMMCKRAIKNIDGSILLKSDSVDKSTFPDWKVTSENADNIDIFGRVRYVFMQV